MNSCYDLCNVVVWVVFFFNGMVSCGMCCSCVQGAVLIWCSLVWCSLVWCSLVWCGVVWGDVRSGGLRSGDVQSSGVRSSGVEYKFVAWCGVLRLVEYTF